MTELKLAFYGDDFTGSTDAMDALSKAGVPTVLFLEPVDTDTIEREFPNAEAVGLAGTSRSMTPTEMEEKLPDKLTSLKALQPHLVHYKVCSTFDSSPEIGSIGRAIDIGARLYDSETVPVLPGAPPLGRYVVFGNMFASDGETVHRLDRHPTMSQHPVTPMNESDLRKHLAKQTEKSMDLLTVRDLNSPESKLRNTFQERMNQDDILFFDSLTREHLGHVGALLWEYASQNTTDPTFTVGSSGLEYALTEYWSQEGEIEGEKGYEPLDPVETTLVMSGSASPITDAQIQTALDAGFSGVRIQTDKLVKSKETDERARVTDEIVEELSKGNSVVAYTARGPDDPAINRAKEAFASTDNTTESIGAFIGQQQGTIMRDALAETDIDRVCIAGGDTCGFVTPSLDIYALEVRYPLAPGSPLCRTSANTDRFDDLEIALKGGQLGHEEYFVTLERGTSEPVDTRA